MFPTASPFPRMKSIINTSGWEVGSCAVLDTVWGGFPVGSWWALVGSAWFLSLCHAGSCWVPGGFPVGSVWVPLALPCSKVGSRWARVGFAAVPCGLGFWGGLRGGVGCKLPPYPPKEKRCARNNIKWERGAQEIARLGRPKACCAHSNTYREETGSYHLASFGHHGNPCLRKARCHLLPSSKTGSCG